MTAPTRPAIAVIGMPEVATAIRAAGFDLLIDDTQDMAAINAAVKEADSRRRQVMVVSCYPFPALAQVGQLLSQLVIKGKKVLVLRSAGVDASAPDIEGTRTIQLPASVNDIMAAFSAPRRDNDAGHAIVNADMTVGARALEPPADVWSQEPDWGQPEQPPAVAPAVPAAPAPAEPARQPAPEQWAPSQPAPQSRPEPQPQQAAQPSPVAPRPVQAQPQQIPHPAPIAPQHAPVQPMYQPQQTQPIQPVPAHQPYPGQPSQPQPYEAQPQYQQPYQQPYAQEPTPPYRPPAADPYSGGGYGAAEPVAHHPPAQPAAGAARRMRRGQRGDLLIVGAGAGGVGKTSMTAAIAERVAVHGPKSSEGRPPRVILIDGSRGQADNRKMLRASGSGIPTIYDAAITGDPARALVMPKLINAARGMLQPIHFAAIFGPRDDQADPGVVTADVYMRAIEHARTIGDFVVLDTQIVEAYDTSGLIDDMVVPLLQEDAWYLMLSDSAHFKIDNANARLRKFSESGVPRDRVAFALNRVNADSTMAYEELGKQMSPYAALYAGAIEHDSRIGAAFETGTIPHDFPDIAKVIDTVVYRMTGLPELDPARLAGAGSGRPSGLRWPRRSRK